MALPFRTANRWVTKRVTPDYTNQLDLFSEAPLETPDPVANAPRRVSGVSQPRPRPQQLGFDVWEPLPPFDAAAVAVTEPAFANTGTDGGTLQKPPAQPDTAAQAETPSSLGIPARRDRSDGKVLDIEPEEKLLRDFCITSAHRIGEGSLHDKARDNIAAIRLLKTLEVENRDATDDEKPALARYIGWGAMPNVFGYIPPGEWRNTAGR